MNIVKLHQVRNIIRTLSALRVSLRQLKKLVYIRRWWTKPHLMPHIRRAFSAYHNVFLYFKFQDHEEFYSFMGMTVHQFEDLYNLTRPLLTKTSRREPLVPELRLAAVIHYLAHGNQVKTTATQFLIGRSTMNKMVPEVCDILTQVLKDVYLKFPEGQDWVFIEEDFNNLWNFSNCLGSLDGMHVRIKCPPNSGTRFHNYKKFFSIVLLALCDARQRIIWASVGDYGSSNDAGIFNHSDLRQKLESDDLDWPNPKVLPGSNVQLPHFIIGDGGFPLKTYLMRPFARSANYGIREKILNYRLSRARRIIECTFGTLQKKWKILENRLSCNVTNACKIVVACLALHNYLITNDGDRYLNGVDHRINDNGQNEDDIENIEEEVMDNNLQNAITIRNTLADYFMSPAGQVGWQFQHIY